MTSFQILSILSEALALDEIDSVLTNEEQEIPTLHLTPDALGLEHDQAIDLAITVQPLSEQQLRFCFYTAANGIPMHSYVIHAHRARWLEEVAEALERVLEAADHSLQT